MWTGRQTLVNIHSGTETELIDNASMCHDRKIGLRCRPKDRPISGPDGLTHEQTIGGAVVYSLTRSGGGGAFGI